MRQEGQREPFRSLKTGRSYRTLRVNPILNFAATTGCRRGSPSFDFSTNWTRGHVLTIGEAFALGVRSGANPATLYDVIKDTSGYSSTLPSVRIEGEVCVLLHQVQFESGLKNEPSKR